MKDRFTKPFDRLKVGLGLLSFYNRVNKIIASKYFLYTTEESVTLLSCPKDKLLKLHSKKCLGEGSGERGVGRIIWGEGCEPRNIQLH